jgi:hypothetical protein
MISNSSIKHQLNGALTRSAISLDRSILYAHELREVGIDPDLLRDWSLPAYGAGDSTYWLMKEIEALLGAHHDCPE